MEVTVSRGGGGLQGGGLCKGGGGTYVQTTSLQVMTYEMLLRKCVLEIADYVPYTPLVISPPMS